MYQPYIALISIEQWINLAWPYLYKSYQVLYSSLKIIHHENLTHRVKHWSSHTWHVWTLDLKAGSSNKGLGYAKWYLGVTSFHNLNESPRRKFNAATQYRKNRLRKQLHVRSNVRIYMYFHLMYATLHVFSSNACHTAIHNPFSSPFVLVVAPPTA